MIQIGENTLSDSHAASDSDARSGSLALRIHGTSRDGQIIQVKSPMCSIGSDRRCTLRLNASGIRPVHCLIVRGRRATVVRRWGPDTLLNGSTFSDAELMPGDRLGIGPIEMEVVQANALPTLPQSPKSQETENSPESVNITKDLNLVYRQRVERLTEQLRHAQEEIGQLRQQLSTSAEEAEQGRTQLAAERERFGSEAGQIEARKMALEQQRADWTLERNEQEKTLAERWAEVNSRDKQLTARAEELNQLHHQIDDQRATLESNRPRREANEVNLDEDRHQMDAYRAELERQRSEFERRQQQWTDERRVREEAWQTERQQFELQRTEFEQTRHELKTRQSEEEETAKQLETQRSEIEALRQRCDAQQAETESLRRQLENRQSELEEMGHELKIERDQLAKDRDAIERDRAEIRVPSGDREAVDTEKDERRAAQQDEVRAEREEFEHEKRQWQAEVQTWQTQWEEERRQFEQQQERWLVKHQEVETRLTDWQHELDAREAQLKKELPATTGRTEPSQAKASARAQAGPAVDRNTPDEVDSSPLVPDEETLCETPSERSTGVTAGTPPHNALEPSETEATSSLRESKERNQAGTTGEDNDESIDEYMSRLMQRLNSMAESPPEPPPLVQLENPAALSRQAYLGANHPFRQKAEHDEATSEETQAAAKRPTTKRRTPILESMSSLAAMREVATASATSAISVHTRNELRKKIRSRLILSLAALTLGVTLIVTSSIWKNSGSNLYIGLIAVFVALLWIIQYALLTGRLIFSQSKGLSWNKDYAEEMAKEAARDTADASENGGETAAKETQPSDPNMRQESESTEKRTDETAS